MKYPRRVQVQGQRVLVKNPQEERELLERSKSQTSDEAKLANALGDENLGLLITRKTKRCLLYTSPSPRDGLLSRMPSSA